jgi:pimeloyl-ACP methyl ester carboxylesterase
MIIDNDGISLHVADDGDPAAPPVLVLHGITSCTATWDWLVPLLVPTHRVLRLDFRGHGGSGRAAGAYHFPEYLSDAVAVCEQVAGAPVVVVGHSLGGGTAAALAQQRPDLVSGVVLEDPALASASDTMDGNSLREAFGMMRQSVPMLQEQGMTVDQVAGLMGQMPSSSGAPLADVVMADALAAMAAGLLMLDASVLDPVLEGSMRLAFDAAATIPVPGIVLAGDPGQPDTIVRQPQIDRLAATSAHIEVRVVAGAGHLIHDSVAHRRTFGDAVLEMLVG